MVEAYLEPRYRRLCRFCVRPVHPDILEKDIECRYFATEEQAGAFRRDRACECPACGPCWLEGTRVCEICRRPDHPMCEDDARALYFPDDQAYEHWKANYACQCAKCRARPLASIPPARVE